MFPAINLHLYGISLTMFDYRRVDGCEKTEFPLLFPSNQLNDDHLWLVSNAEVHIFAQHDRFHSPPIDVATSVQDVVHFCARLAFASRYETVKENYAAIMHGSGGGLAEAETKKNVSSTPQLVDDPTPEHSVEASPRYRWRTWYRGWDMNHVLRCSVIMHHIIISIYISIYIYIYISNMYYNISVC